VQRGDKRRERTGGGNSLKGRKGLAKIASIELEGRLSREAKRKDLRGITKEESHSDI